jgi:tetratricopeptide (TPR) repeat protein
MDEKSKPFYTHRAQNFLLLWLNGNTDDASDQDCYNSSIKLRQVVNTMNIFTDADECIDFITDIEEERIFLIVSGIFSQIIVPLIESIHHVTYVYIVCENRTEYEQWAKQWSKVKGVFTNITPIYKALKQAAQECDHNMVSMSFVKSGDEVEKKNLDELDQSFMYTQILKGILLTVDFEEIHINEFLNYCREQFVGNVSALRDVETFQKEYRNHPPIWWYTCGSFLYSMLNKALRTMEIDLIIRMGFFIRDLHQHLARLYSEQYDEQNHSNSFTVFRGQGLSKTDFDQLIESKGGLISFNNFLSTSVDQLVSLAFAESNLANLDLIGVFFKIVVNPSTPSTPFGNAINDSYFKEEEEILFSMHSVFRIGEMKKINENNRLWQVDLTLTSDNDPQLHALTERIREETFPDQEGWYRLGAVLFKLGQFNKAQELYDILLERINSESEKRQLYHMLGLVKNGQGKYTEATKLLEKSLEILQKTGPPNHPDFAISYVSLGLVYDDMSEYSKALSYYEKALAILQEIHPSNHPSLANSYNNIGRLYYNMGKYSKALSYYEKALEIWEKTLPPNHPDLATSYNNIGLLYDNMSENSKALSYYEKVIKIQQKALPSDHPALGISYNNIGTAHYKMGDYSKAHPYYEKALDIKQKTVSPSHPSCAISYNNIGIVRVQRHGRVRESTFIL